MRNVAVVRAVGVEAQALAGVQPVGVEAGAVAVREAVAVAVHLGLGAGLPEVDQALPG
jgi:hypothetical protein